MTPPSPAGPIGPQAMPGRAEPGTVPDGFALLLAGLAPAAPPKAGPIASDGAAADDGPAESRIELAGAASPGATALAPTSSMVALALPTVASPMAVPGTALPNTTPPVGSPGTSGPNIALPSMEPPSAGKPIDRAGTGGPTNPATQIPAPVSSAAEVPASALASAPRAANAETAAEAMRGAAASIPTVRPAAEMTAPPGDPTVRVAPRTPAISERSGSGLGATDREALDTAVPPKSSDGATRGTAAQGPEVVTLRQARPDPIFAQMAAAREAAASTDASLDPMVEDIDAAPTRAERPVSESPAPAPRSSAPPPAAQIGMQIARAVPAGVTRMLVQLQPAQLGRVEVHLRVGRDNRIAALITAEHPDTLDALQRDVRTLARSLEAAGLHLDDQALSFTLAERDPRDDRPAGGNDPWARTAGISGVDAGDAGAPRPGPASWIVGTGLIDIRV